MSAKVLILALLATSGLATSAPGQSKDACVACDPSGIKSTASPAVGSDDLAQLYTSLLESVKGIQLSRRGWYDDIHRRAKPAPICCAQGTQCLLLADYGLPFCYDKFTTNYFLPDGSYGTVHTGEYTAKSGGTANLITGEYNLSGSVSNIYAGKNEGSKPNTSVLSIPPQWTSSGVGSAIPVTALGVGVTVMSTITGPTTIAGLTIQGTTVPARTVSGSVIPATTILGTTLSAQTYTATTTVATTESQPTSVAASTPTTSRNSASNSLVPQVQSNTALALTLLGALLL